MMGLLVLELSARAVAVHALLLAVFLTLSALFAAAEASLVSTPAYYRRHLVERDGGEASRRLGSSNRVFVTVVVGNALSNVAIAVLVASLTLGLVDVPLAAGLALAGLIALVIVLTVGELLPRAVATADPDRVARRVTGPVAVLQRGLYPVIRLFEGFSTMVFSAVGAPPKRRVFLDEAELQHMLEVGQEQGVLAEDEHDMITSVIELGEVDVGDVMVPRTDIVAVEADAEIQDVADQVTSTGFSRIPVYEADLDAVVGVVYGKDLLDAVSSGREGPVSQLAKEALFVPETAPLDETLREMKTRRIHIAIVHDEFGGTAGLVSLEDVLEEIVGDIFDEYDPEAEAIEWIGEDVAILDARMDIEEVNDALDIGLPEDEGYETLGGYLFHELGRPGRAGETLTRDSVDFTLERVANRRILKVRAERTPDEAARAGDART